MVTSRKGWGQRHCVPMYRTVRYVYTWWSRLISRWPPASILPATILQKFSGKESKLESLIECHTACQRRHFHICWWSLCSDFLSLQSVLRQTSSKWPFTSHLLHTWVIAGQDFSQSLRWVHDSPCSHSIAYSFALEGVAACSGVGGHPV